MCQAQVAHVKRPSPRQLGSRPKKFAVGQSGHTAKALPCARYIAHGKGALCRRLFAVCPRQTFCRVRHMANLLSCVFHGPRRKKVSLTPPTLDVPFAMCQGASTWQSSHVCRVPSSGKEWLLCTLASLLCARQGHTAKNSHFAVCPPYAHGEGPILAILFVCFGMYTKPQSFQ